MTTLAMTSDPMKRSMATPPPLMKHAAQRANGSHCQRGTNAPVCAWIVWSRNSSFP